MGAIIVVGFDPVAAEVYVANEAGAVFFSAPAGRVITKHYREDGVLYCDLWDDEARLAFYDASGQAAALVLELSKDRGQRLRLL